ncbi:MAG: hypothetical protein SFT94_00050 [Pseudanabaenaceae cyanobacterium bins.68]|nr:hypothetical protein [Pseudanabaenaceae cyanobacterium bins.68]
MADSDFKLQNYRSRPKKLGMSRQSLAIAGTSTLVLVGLNLDWRLVLGAGAAAVMTGVYRLQGCDWRQLRLRLGQLWQGENGRLITAALAGVGAMLLVYVLSAIWQGQADHWLALADSLELLASLSILAWLAASFWRSAEVEQHHLERLVLDLTSEHELQRLVALRQLGEYLGYASPAQELAIAEYCQVLLQSESCPVVRTAALELITHVSGQSPKGLAPNS